MKDLRRNPDKADGLVISKPQTDASLKRSWSIAAAADSELPFIPRVFDHPKESFLTARLTSEPLAEMRQASAAFLENVVGDSVPALMTRAMEAFKAPLNIFLSRPALTFRAGATMSPEQDRVQKTVTPFAPIESDSQLVDSESPVLFFRPTTFLDDKKSPSQILSELPYYEGSTFDDMFESDLEDPLDQQLEPVEQREDKPLSSWSAAIQTLVNGNLLTADEVELLEAASPPELMADSRKLNDVVDRLLSIARRIGHGAPLPQEVIAPVERIYLQSPPEVVVMTPTTEPVSPFIPIEPPLPLVFSRPYDPYSLSFSPREVPRGVPLQQYPRDYLTFYDPAMDSYLHKAYLPAYNPAQLLLDPIARGRYIYAMDGGRGMNTQPNDQDLEPAAAAASPPDRPFSRELPFTIKSLKMNLKDYLDQAAI